MIYCDGAAITMTILTEQLLNEGCIVGNALTVTVVAVDKHHKVGSLKRHLSTLIVTSRCTNPTLCIAVDRQSGYIE